ncbi:MAG: SAM-dependent methyltransferase [Pseudomonadota bacterium]
MSEPTPPNESSATDENASLDAALFSIIKERILMDGPLSVADYMALCLTHPDHGYYTTGTPLGGRASNQREGGDFITAPEISQLFGEMIAVWSMEVWQALGCPKPFTLAEIGPGRGTLMRDFLRVARALPGFLDAADIHLIEISPTLGEQQSLTLGEHLARMKWVRSIDDLPDQPTILIGNELLDALPFRQWIKHSGRWHERGIGLLADGSGLQFVLRPNTLPPPHDDVLDASPDGTIFETAPAREGFVRRLADHISKVQGAALLIDYGHRRSKPGDTFQALQDHAHVDVLAAPGCADLTSHVDFQPLEQIVREAGCIGPPVTTQGEFLAALGIAERCGSLGQGQRQAVQAMLQDAAERLVLPAGNGQGHHPVGMGSLFKVFAFGAPASLGERWPGFG